MRMAVGGASDAGTIPERRDGNLEPVAWHQTSSPVWMELLRSECVAGCVIDWTPMDVLAWQSLELGTPYIGVCYTEKHCRALYDRLATLMFHKMKEEGKFFRPELAKILNVKTPAAATKAKPKAEPKGKSEAKPMGEAKPQAIADIVDAKDGAEKAEKAEIGDAGKKRAASADGGSSSKVLKTGDGNADGLKEQLKAALAKKLEDSRAK